MGAPPLPLEACCAKRGGWPSVIQGFWLRVPERIGLLGKHSNAIAFEARTIWGVEVCYCYHCMQRMNARSGHPPIRITPFRTRAVRSHSVCRLAPKQTWMERAFL